MTFPDDIKVNEKRENSSNKCNRISGVTVIVLASSAVDSEFESLQSQTKGNKIGICCFSTKRKVYLWTIVSVSQHYKILIKRVGLVQSEHHHHLIEMQLALAMIWLKNYLLDVKKTITHSHKCNTYPWYHNLSNFVYSPRWKFSWKDIPCQLLFQFLQN